MARFSGNIGFGADQVVSPGVHDEVITTRFYKGTVERDSRTFRADAEVVGEVSVSHSISIIADEYAIAHLQDVRFVEWDGGFWVVTSRELSRPRLILGLGGVYNGPKA